MRYDLTHFKNLQEQLNFLVQATFPASPPATIDPWKQSLDQIINTYLTENKINLQALSSSQKRELISRLHDKGLFDFKESSAYVASKLQISRATVYNYLKTAAHFRKVRVHQVDAFTNKRFGGNPAGVVLDADDLDEITCVKLLGNSIYLKQPLCCQVKRQGSICAILLPTGHEITFCGHSTVGALYMIAKEKRFGIEKIGLYPFDVETSCGVLKMEVKIDNDEEIKVAYETPRIKLRSRKFLISKLLKPEDLKSTW